MKNFIAHFLSTLLFLIFFCNNTFAQRNIGGTPYSFSEEFQKEFPDHSIKTRNLNSLDKNQLREEDETTGVTNRYSVHIPVNLNLNNSGKWTDLSNGDRIWQLKIKAADADGLMLTYEEFSLPDEALLFIYNEEKTQVKGAFSSFNNRDGSDFSTATIHGEVTILEYYEPKEVYNQGVINIDNVSFVYNEKDLQRGYGDELGCHKNINCVEGSGWTTEKRGIVRIITVFENPDGSDGEAYFCSGALTNNALNNKVPYILSAYHCVYSHVGAGKVAMYGSFQFHFNYELSCGGSAQNSPEPEPDEMSGCTLKARRFSNDFMLLRINDFIPEDYNPYFLGWDNTGDDLIYGASIHHPRGSIKRITIDYDEIEVVEGNWTFNYGDLGSYTFLGDLFYQLYPDAGVFERGSSGAPLLNLDGRIVGYLVAGNNLICSNPNGKSGRLNKAWTPSSNSGFQLKHWLDPYQLGYTSWPGLNGGPTPGCGNDIMWEGELDAINSSTWGATFEFIKGEMNRNVVSLREAYFHNVDEVDRIFKEDKPEYAKVQKALKQLIFRGSRTFFKAFVFGIENELSEGEMTAFRDFLKELYPLLQTEEIKVEIQKLYTGMKLGVGKDLKTAMKDYDQANLENLILMPNEENRMNNQFQLINSLGNFSTLCYEIFEESEVQIELFDLNGKPIRNLLNENVEKGKYQIDISKNNLPNGVYLIQTQVKGESDTLKDVQKMMVME